MIATIACDWKCLKEADLPLEVCQNSHTNLLPTLEISINKLIKKYKDNLLSECIIFAGLEPMLQFEEVLNFISEFRKVSSDDIIIYTGYYLDEILKELQELKRFDDIIIKFGRFIPDSNSVYDKILKINLASNNQYAKRIKEL